MSDKLLRMSSEEYTKYIHSNPAPQPAAGSKPGLFSRLKSGVKQRIDERVEDLNQRIEHPREWREKHQKLKMQSDAQRIRELKQETKLARLQASKARSEHSVRKYTAPINSGGYGGEIFDLGMGGGGAGVPLFDMGSGGAGSVTLFDMGMSGGGGSLFDMGMSGGGKQKKKRKNKKSKHGNGVHIHIGK